LQINRRRKEQSASLHTPLVLFAVSLPELPRKMHVCWRTSPLGSPLSQLVYTISVTAGKAQTKSFGTAAPIMLARRPPSHFGRVSLFETANTNVFSSSDRIDARYPPFSAPQNEAAASQDKAGAPRSTE